MNFILALILPLAPVLGLLWVVRHGPFRNRWWGGETIFGFALLVGMVTFSAGFFGPMMLMPNANQGPLLGIFYTGPIGFMLGLMWGVGRAWDRRSVDSPSGRKV